MEKLASVLVAVIAVSMLLSISAWAETIPINITSDRMLVENDKRIVIFKGDVEVVREDMVINTDLLRVYYNKNREIERMEARGNVRIKREGSLAVGDSADFFNKEDKLVLIGNARFTEGTNSVEGEKMTFFIKEGRSIVESGGKGRVKAVFVPEEGQKEGAKR